MALAMTACLIGLASVAYVRHLSWLADGLVGQIESMSPEDATAALRRTAELDERGLPVLVAALGSRSEDVVRATRQVILEQIDRWELLSADETRDRLTRLAELLAERVEGYDDRGRRAAAAIASRILRWPAHTTASRRETLVAACAKVLRASGQDVLPRSRIAVTNPTPERIRAAQETHSAARRAEPLEAELSLDALAPLPGGGLPLDATVAARANARASIGPGGATSTAGEFQAARSSTEGEGRENPSVPGGLPPVPSQIGESVGNQVGGSANPLVQFRRDDAPPQESQPSSPDEGRSGYEAFDLMRMLRDPDASIVAWAEGQLRTLGFDEAHIELARRLTDPAARVRRAWASRLPGMQGIDAQAWLLWLVEDADAEVRLTAITFLATSSADQKVLEQIASIARRDRDERVRRQAERILAQRSQR